MLRDITTTTFLSKKIKKNKTKSSAAKIVVCYIAAYLKTVTVLAQSQGKGQELEDHTLSFIKSIVPDVNKLGDKPPPNLSDNTSLLYMSNIRPPSSRHANFGQQFTEEDHQQFRN